MRFWEDGWKDDEILLMVKYPRLYLISNEQNKYIQQMGSSAVWMSDPNGIYTVCSAYKLLDKDSRDDNLDGAFKDIWKLKIPSKAAFFAWGLIWDRLSTKSNLCRRNVVINDKLCLFCRDKEEEAAHLFFSCDNFKKGFGIPFHYWSSNIREGFVSRGN